MRLERLLLFALTLLCFPVHSQAQPWAGVLDPARAIDWSHAGVVGGIPTNYTQCVTSACNTVFSAGASATAGQIQTALNSAPANTYVLLAPGIYTNMSGGIQWNRNNVVLRGSGSNWNTGTRLVFAGGQHASCGGFAGNICIVSTNPNYAGGGEQNIGNLVSPTGSCAGSFAKGSTTLCLGTQTTGSTKPSAGITLQFDQLTDGTTRAQDTGDVFVCGAHPVCTQQGPGSPSRSGRMQQQVVKVVSISAGTCTDASPCTMTITPGLYMPNWRISQVPQAWWPGAPFNTGSGVENLGMDISADCSQCPGPGAGTLAAIDFYNAENAWAENVHVEYTGAGAAAPSGTTRGMRFTLAHNITVRDSYIHGRTEYDDYGTAAWQSSDILVENTIFHNTGIPMMNETCSGCVFGYNFTVRHNWGPLASCTPFPQPCWAQGAVYGHGTQESYMLAEGNMGAFGLELENYFGNAFFVTAFRNRFIGEEDGQTSQTVPILLNGLNRYENIVGNVLGLSGYHTQYMMFPTGSTTTNISNCINAVYAIGIGGACGNGDGSSSPLNDTLALASHMIWGNYDTANSANRFVAGENGSAAPKYPGLSNPSTTLPFSFYKTSKPAWWPSSTPWPPIGPDISGGNVGVCSGGAQAGSQATSASQCTGGTLVSAGLNGEVNSIPAMNCFLNVMGGTPSGVTSGILTAFDGNACYSGTPPPLAPASLKATLQ